VQDQKRQLLLVNTMGQQYEFDYLFRNYAAETSHYNFVAANSARLPKGAAPRGQTNWAVAAFWHRSVPKTSGI
jgi:hypothetical protein